MPTLADFGVDESGGVLGAGNTNTLNSIGNPLAAATPRPTLSLGPGMTGRMTWFNPKPWTYNDPATGRVWTDAAAQARREGTHASGLPISTPGFATSNRQWLGKWHEVTLPDGRKYITQQTDIGPPGVVDLNAALASQAYPGGPQSVPGGKVSTRFIGANLPEGVTPGPAAGGGWNTTVSADAGQPGGAGYVNPAGVPQGATTNPAELQRPPEGGGFDLASMVAGLKYSPKQIKQPAPFQFDAPLMRMTPIGRRRA